MTQTSSTSLRALEFAARSHRIFIGGEWVPAASGETFDTINPATEELLATVPKGGAEDIDRAVRAARNAFEYDAPWRRMTPSERGKVVHRIGDLILENADELAMIETLDNGKPFSVARHGDIPFAADVFHYMSGWATKLEGSSIPLGQKYLAFTQKEPVGVVGVVIAWNFPLLLCAWKLGPALAAGCTVVVKPAEQTPLAALRLAEIAREAGLPDGVLNVVTGYGDAGAALTAHPHVDKVTFTGSTEVGRKIVHAATGNLKKVSLELGGKSPNIVYADADLATAIPAVANAIFAYHGQACNAGSRLYVEKSIFDKVVAGVSDYANSIVLGPGAESTTQMGPLVSEEQLDRILGYIAAGKGDGAQIAAGGERHGSKGYFVKPTVLTDTRPDMSVVREEIFGPVLVTMPFTDPADVIRQANDTSYGLAAGVFTTDLSRAYTTAARLQAGTVYINQYHMLNAALPFGGYKESGWGRELGRLAVDDFMESKSVVAAL